MTETRQQRKLKEIRGRFKQSKERYLRPSVQQRADWYGKDMAYVLQVLDKVLTDAS